MNVAMSSRVPRTTDMEESANPTLNIVSSTRMPKSINKCIAALQRRYYEAMAHLCKEVVKSPQKDGEYQEAMSDCVLLPIALSQAALWRHLNG